MSNAFGHEFIVVNSVYQPLTSLSKRRNGKPYYHLATVRRGFKEYMAYVDPGRNRVWIEEVDPKEPWLLKHIADENEWQDLKDFLYDQQLLEIGSRREIAAGEEGLLVR